MWNDIRMLGVLDRGEGALTAWRKKRKKRGLPSFSALSSQCKQDRPLHSITGLITGSDLKVATNFITGCFSSGIRRIRGRERHVECLAIEIEYRLNYFSIDSVGSSATSVPIVLFENRVVRDPR